MRVWMALLFIRLNQTFIFSNSLEKYIPSLLLTHCMYILCSFLTYPQSTHDFKHTIFLILVLKGRGKNHLNIISRMSLI